MTQGPNWSYQAGKYQAQFPLRFGSINEGELAILDIYDSKVDSVMMSKVITKNDILKTNEWDLFTLEFNTTNDDNSLEFRTLWKGIVNMDIALVRIKKIGVNSNLRVK